MPVLHAPAKINATLEILGRREDGYHTLRSVMLPVALYDRIELDRGPHPGLHVDDPALARNNLVDRALAACDLGGRFAVTLQKTIPVGGGLGGGSSDAAAILRAAMDGTLADQTGKPPQARDWLALARTLGSDVPFFLAGTAALIEGTGERVTALGRLPSWWCVIACPGVAVATADAYRLLDQARAARAGGAASRPRTTSASLTVVDALQRADFAAFRAALVNDFHDVVLTAYPPVASAAAALRNAGAEPVLLSGSGACLFTPFACETDARAVHERLHAATPVRSFVVALHHDAAWR